MTKLKEWMEQERLNSLESDWHTFLRTYYPKPEGGVDAERYEEDKKRIAKAAEDRRASYETESLKMTGIAAVVALGGVIFLEGFLAGAVFVAALAFAGVNYHSRTNSPPDFSEEADFREEDLREREKELLKRKYNEDYDRDRTTTRRRSTTARAVSPVGKGLQR